MLCHHTKEFMVIAINFEGKQQAAHEGQNSFIKNVKQLGLIDNEMIETLIRLTILVLLCR